jgi:elongation factor G
MKVYDAASLRNVALVGHSGSGKTQLVSALLFDAGAVNRLGKVDEGTTVTDYDEEEIARKHTLSASIAFAEWTKTKINFIDTPGMANFLSDARAALRVADGALVVVDAVSGVEVSTEKVWEVADDLAVPRIIVLNRVDRVRASRRAGATPDRGGKEFQGHRRSRRDEGVHVRGRQAVRRPGACRSRIGRADRSRDADRDGRGSR